MREGIDAGWSFCSIDDQMLRVVWLFWSLFRFYFRNYSKFLISSWLRLPVGPLVQRLVGNIVISPDERIFACADDCP